MLSIQRVYAGWKTIKAREEKRERREAWAVGVIIGLSLIVAACLAGCATPAERYIRSDAKTYNLVAPELVKLDATDRGWLAVVESWRARIEEAALAAGLTLDLWSAPEPSRVPANEPSRAADAADTAPREVSMAGRDGARAAPCGSTVQRSAAPEGASRGR